MTRFSGFYVRLGLMDEISSFSDKKQEFSVFPLDDTVTL